MIQQPQQAQIIQTSDGQTFIYQPMQLDGGVQQAQPTGISKPVSIKIYFFILTYVCCTHKHLLVEILTPWRSFLSEKLSHPSSQIPHLIWSCHVAKSLLLDSILSQISPFHILTTLFEDYFNVSYYVCLCVHLCLRNKRHSGMVHACWK